MGEVLVVDDVAVLDRTFELRDERRPRHRRLLIASSSRRSTYASPFAARLPRQQWAWPCARVEQKRIPEPESKRLHAQTVEPLDADRLVSAPDAEKHALASPLVDALHQGQSGLTLVEPLDHRAPEPKEPPAEVGTSPSAIPPRPCREAASRSAGGRPLSAARAAAREPARRCLPFVRERPQKQDGLRERPDGVVADDRLARARNLCLRHVRSLAGFHILDSRSACWYLRHTRWP